MKRREFLTRGVTPSLGVGLVSLGSGGEADLFGDDLNCDEREEGILNDPQCQAQDLNPADPPSRMEIACAAKKTREGLCSWAIPIACPLITAYTLESPDPVTKTVLAACGGGAGGCTLANNLEQTFGDYRTIHVCEILNKEEANTDANGFVRVYK